MKFYERLNKYIESLDCTAKVLSDKSGVSPATLSRYRSGERIPDMDSEAFTALCKAIAGLAAEKGNPEITYEKVAESFISCSDFVSTDREQFRKKFNMIVTALDINLSNLCQYTNYDVSTVFRIRNGTRQPADPEQFASSVASYVSHKHTSDNAVSIISELIGCEGGEIYDRSVRYAKIKSWLLSGNGKNTDTSGVSSFLNKLDEFDLNEFIKAIHFDDMKVPSLPFQLSTSKMYYGLDEMMKSELDFMKATVLSKSKKPVTLYSDMPMTEMAKDPEFPKKWMGGMAFMLKKGLVLKNIHNLDRPFEEMMLGLESWIPMYMTGQIVPYYLKTVQSGAFHHILRVSGAAALSGEAVFGHHADGRYYLSKTKEDIAYYQKRADDLIENSRQLMDIYRSDRADELSAFLLSDEKNTEKRRNILSVPPLYTLNGELLEKIFESNKIPQKERDGITAHIARQKERFRRMTAVCAVEDEIPIISREEFEEHPVFLQLSEMFFDKDIKYTYEQYERHIELTRDRAENNGGYTVSFTRANAFRNLQIYMREGKWAMISKGNAPSIHFVIHHPKLRNAIENFVPLIVEGNT